MENSPLIYEKATLKTSKCGDLSVFYNIKSTNFCTILTVHDLGCSYRQYVEFLEQPVASELAKKVSWIHINLPGQCETDPPLAEGFNFPSMQDIADEINLVLQHFEVKNVILLGEGAGANILSRFAMVEDDRLLGAILIHCVGNSDNILEKTNTKLAVTSKLQSQGMHPVASEYLVRHRFGKVKENYIDLREAVEKYKVSLNHAINPKNLNAFITSYLNRTNIRQKVSQFKHPILFMTGALASHNSAVMDLYHATLKAFEKDAVKKAQYEMIQIEDVGNVLVENPSKVIEGMQYFLQGLGLVGGLRIMSANERLTQQRSSVASDGKRGSIGRRMSMQEFDLPKGADALSNQRKSSLVAPTEGD